MFVYKENSNSFYSLSENFMFFFVNPLTDHFFLSMLLIISENFLMMLKKVSTGVINYSNIYVVYQFYDL